MRKIITGLVALTMLTSTPNVIFAQTPSLTNGNFDEGTSGWKTVGASFNTVPGGVGGDCGEIVMNDAYGRAYNTFKFERGVKYKLSVYVKLKEGRNTASLIVDHRSYGDKSLIKAVAKDVRVSAKEWTKLTTVYEWNGEGTGEANLYVRIGDALTPITHYIDSMSVTQHGDSVRNFEKTVLNEGELAQNSGFDTTVEGYMATNAKIAHYKGEGAEKTDGCASVTVDGAGSSVGQKIELLPNTVYQLSAYVKSSGGRLYCPFGAVKESKVKSNGGKYIKDYAVSGGSAPETEIIPTDTEAGDEWTYVTADYTYRGNEKGYVYIGIYPNLQKGNVFYIDKFSVVKKGEAAEVKPGSTLSANAGFYVNNVIVSPDGGYKFEKGTALVNASAIAELIGADYSVDADSCTITKGLTVLRIDTKTAIASVNNNLIPLRAVYKNGREYAIDIKTVCDAFGAKAELSQKTNTVKITLSEEKTGLSNLSQKLAQDKKANIAFIGGATAYGRGASIKDKTSYRALVMNWLGNMYTDCEFTELNHTIGSTDANLDVYRIDTLLAQNPDVIFVDFCNEGITNLESLVYRIRTKSPKTDIVFLESINDAMAADYKLGNTPDIIKEYDAVAAEYKIPVVNMGLKLYDESVAAKENLPYYMTYIHFPNDIGHKVYADMICEFIKESLLTPAKVHTYDVKADSDILTGTVIDVTKAKVNGFTENKGTLNGNIGDELTFEFEGNIIGLLWDAGIDTGAVEYVIDGKTSGVAVAFDEFGVRSVHTTYTILDDSLKNGKHTLSIRVIDDKDSMSLGNRIMIKGFLVGTTAKR